MRPLPAISALVGVCALGCSSGAPVVSIHNAGSNGATVWALQKQADWKQVGTVLPGETKNFEPGGLADDRNLRIQSGPGPVQTLGLNGKTASGGCGRSKETIFIDPQGRADFVKS